jgi:hypothetical protein
MRRYIVEEFLKITDSMRHAAQIRMDADRHDPRRNLALLIQAIELALATFKQLCWGVLPYGHYGDVVDFDRVRQRNQGTGRRFQFAGEVVDDPVGDVADTFVCEEISRVGGTVRLSAHWAEEGDFLRAESQAVAAVLEISLQTAKARSREARRKSAGTDSG